MSVTSNQVFSTWKVVDDFTRRSTYVRQGRQLNPSQNRIWRDSVGLWAMAWIDLTCSSLMPLPRWLKPWLQEIATTDIVDVVATLKFADQLLILERSCLSNYETFKQSLKSHHMKVGVVSPLKGLIDQWYLYRDTTTFASLHTAFTFVTRVNLPDLEDLEVAAYENYLANEDRLGSLSDFSDEETAIITSWFPYTNVGHLYDGWRPKHGPGSVADITHSSLLKKYRNGGTDSMTKRLDLLLGGNTQYNPTKRLSRMSRVVFVPKSVDKLRTICMEPAALMWYQQGFLYSILEELKLTPLRRRIELEDQTKSHVLCYEGSIDGKYSTIDLSDASDSVSVSLVKQWFRRSSLLPVCMMTRSKTALLPTGEVLALKKFAPMGSALCFPIECIVFCAIVEASILEAGGSVRDSNYRVYGDDIIVETRYAPTVVRRLERNGFKVNTSKSFFTTETHNFRESCGAEFLDGEDVSALRLPRNFSGIPFSERRYTPSSIAVAIDLCNQFYSRLPSVRRVLISHLLKLRKEKRPVFDETGEIGIFSPNPTNHHLPKQTYVKRYQQWYTTHGGLRISSKDYKKKHVDEGVALYDTLRLIATRSKLSIPDKPYFAAMNRQPSLRWSVTKTVSETLLTQESTGKSRGDHK